MSRTANRLLFLFLSVIWGSSFILMKEGLRALTPLQVASVRIVAAGLVLLPVTLRHIRSLPRTKIVPIFFSGVLGSLIPAFLFCKAEVEIDSTLAGTLNSLTPVFTILAGSVLFGRKALPAQVAGVAISLAGSVLLFFAQPGSFHYSGVLDISLIIIATVMYGININVVGRYFQGLPSLHIAAVALSLNVIPAAIMLAFAGFFSLTFSPPVLIATGYSAVLGIMGTALASILFYRLIKEGGAVFSSMVTYAIPVVALGWGLLYGERPVPLQLVSLLIILCGVWVANRMNRRVA